MNRAKLALVYVFHPLEAMDIIKRERDKLKIYPVVILYALAFLSHLLSLLITHYPLRSMQPEDINFALELLKVNGIVFSWIVAAYAISSIMSGEARFIELLTASAYAYIPFIILSPVVALISNLLSQNNMGFYVTLQSIIIGWIVLGLIFSFVRQCDYGFGQTILVGLLSLVLMLLIWGLLVLFVALCIQAGSFLTDIFQEISFKYF